MNIQLLRSEHILLFMCEVCQKAQSPSECGSEFQASPQDNKKLGCGEKGGVHPMGLGILILAVHLVEMTECALGWSSALLGLYFCLSITVER